MTPTRHHLMVGGLALALGIPSLGALSTRPDDDDEKQATGPAAEQARQAAVRMFKGSRANAVERDSEAGATWEVELTLSDGEVVDVRLDERYRFVLVAP